MNSIINQLRRYHSLFAILQKFSDIGETFIFGGALRDFRDNMLSTPPRDFDIVVDTNDEYLSQLLDSYLPYKNRFGGYKIDLDGLSIDVWCLAETWAFKEKKIICKPVDYRERLQDTVFLNLDSIVYSFSQNQWFDKKYIEAMRTKTLDVVLEENPQLALNIVRAIVLKRKYTMAISSELASIIRQYTDNNSNSIRSLIDIQNQHYKRVLLSSKILEDELKDI